MPWNIPNPDLKNDPRYLEPRITEVSSQLADKVTKNDMNIERKRQYARIRKNNPISTLARFQYPFLTLLNDTFSLRYDVNLPLIYIDGKGGFKTNWDISSYRHISSRTIYVDTINGTSTSDGLTRSTPCHSLEKALTIASNGDTILFINDSGTVIGRSGWALDGIITKSVNVIAENENVIVFKGDIPSWAKTIGQSNVYEVVRSNVVRLVDMNNIDSPIEFLKVDSIDQVDYTVNSWYNDGSKTYVNCGFGKIPNNKILPLLTATLANTEINSTTQNIKLYIENFTLVGGGRNINVVGNTSYNAHELYTKNVRCFYSTQGDSILVLNALRAYHQNTTAAYSQKDGFNYSTTIGGSNIVDFIEVDCLAYANGNNSLNTTNTHNGSSAHAKSRGIRLNCTYYDNVGGQLVDVQGVFSVNLGCIAFDSKSTDLSYNHGIGTQGSQGIGTVEMWFEGCTSFGCATDVYCPTDTIIHVRQSQYDTIAGNGTKDLDQRL